MKARRLIVAGILAVAVLSLAWAGGVISLPWSHDLDNQLSIKPQEMPVLPPEGSVPVTGTVVDPAREQAAALGNPTGGAADTSSLRRGANDFHTYCAPCHGAGGKGDGTVAKSLPIPPPNLTDPALQSTRTDGAIYYVIRHGSVIMPSYSYALDSQRAWNVVNYVRSIRGQ